MESVEKAIRKYFKNVLEVEEIYRLDLVEENEQYKKYEVEVSEYIIDDYEIEEYVVYYLKKPKIFLYKELYEVDDEYYEEIDHEDKLLIEMLKKLKWDNRINEIKEKYKKELQKLINKLEDEGILNKFLTEKNKKLKYRFFEIDVRLDFTGEYVLVLTIRNDVNNVVVSSDKESYKKIQDNSVVSFFTWELGIVSSAVMKLARWLYTRNICVEIGDVCVPCYLFCRDSPPCGDGVHCDGSCEGRDNVKRLVTNKEFAKALAEALEYD